MKILITISYFQPDIGYAESKLAEQLSQQGHQVEVLTSNYYFPFPDFDNSVGAVLHTRQCKVGTKKKGKVKIIRKKQLTEVFARSVFLGIENEVSRFRPDIVVSFGVTAPATIQIALLKKKYDYEFVAVDSHLPSELERGNSLAKKIFYLTFRALFSPLLNSTIDSCIALQEATASIISKEYGITLPVKIIPHGSDISEFYFDKPSRETIRKKLGWLEKYFVIIYTGKVIEAKGVFVLFEAFDQLLKKGCSARLLIVGDGSDDYKRFCLSKLDSKFHHLVSWQGFIQQKTLYKYYSAADVAVWPMQESLAMNDAAACQLPFIANDSIGATLRISNDNALLYKKGDSKDLALKLNYLYGNPVRRKNMGKRGRALIESKLSWQKLSKLFITTTNEK